MKTLYISLILLFFFVFSAQALRNAGITPISAPEPRVTISANTLKVNDSDLGTSYISDMPVTPEVCRDEELTGTKPDIGSPGPADVTLSRLSANAFDSYLDNNYHVIINKALSGDSNPYNSSHSGRSGNLVVAPLPIGKDQESSRSGKNDAWKLLYDWNDRIKDVWREVKDIDTGSPLRANRHASANTFPWLFQQQGKVDLGPESVASDTIFFDDDDLEAEDMELEIVENIAADSVIGKLSVEGGSGIFDIVIDPPSDLFKIDPKTLEIISKTFLDYESLIATGGNVFELDVTIYDLSFEEDEDLELEITVIDDGFQAFAVEEVNVEVVENQVAGTKVARFVPAGGSEDYASNLMSASSDLFAFDDQTLEFTTTTFLDYEEIIAKGSNVTIFEVGFMDNITREEATATMQITVTDDGFQPFTVSDVAIEVVENQVAGTTVARFVPAGGSEDYASNLMSASSDFFAFDDQTLEFTTTTFLDYEEIIAKGSNVTIFEVDFTDNITREEATATMQITVTDDGFQPFTVSDVAIEVVENQVAGTTVARFVPAGGSGNHMGKILSASSDLFAFDDQTLEFTATTFLDYEEIIAKGSNVTIFEVDFTDNITREEATATMQITVTDDGFQVFAVEDVEAEVVENQVAGTIVARFTLADGPENYSARVLSASSDFFAFDDQTLGFMVKDFLDYEEMMAEGSNVAIFEVIFTDNTTWEQATATMQITVTDDGFQPFTVSDVAIEVVENQLAGTPVARFTPAGGSGSYTARRLSASSGLFAFDNQTLKFTTANFLDYEAMMANGGNVVIFEVNFLDNITREQATATMQITVTDDGFQPFTVSDVAIEVVENQVAGTPVARLEQEGGSGSYVVRILSASSGLFAFDDRSLEFFVSDFLDYEEMVAEGSNVAIFEVNFRDNITREEATATVKIKVTDDGFQPFTVADEDATMADRTNTGTVIAQFNPQGGSSDCTAALTYASTGLFSFDTETFAFKLARPVEDQDIIDMGMNTATYEVNFKDKVTREEAAATMKIEITGVVTGMETLNEAGYHFLVGKDKKICFTGPGKTVHSFKASVYNLEGRRVGTLNFSKTGDNTWESDNSIAEGLNIVLVTGLDKTIYTFKILSQ